MNVSCRPPELRCAWQTTELSANASNDQPTACTSAARRLRREAARGCGTGARRPCRRRRRRGTAPSATRASGPAGRPRCACGSRRRGRGWPAGARRCAASRRASPYVPLTSTATTRGGRRVCATVATAAAAVIPLLQSTTSGQPARAATPAAWGSEASGRVAGTMTASSAAGAPSHRGQHDQVPVRRDVRDLAGRTRREIEVGQAQRGRPSGGRQESAGGRGAGRAGRRARPSCWLESDLRAGTLQGSVEQRRASNREPIASRR